MKAVEFFKALGDESRLAILSVLAEKPAYTEVLATRLKLAASTISFHLRRLEAVGLVESHRDQYYTIYSLRRHILERSLESLVISLSLRKQSDGQESDYKEKVLAPYFRAGKLLRIPSQKIIRELALQRVGSSFLKGKVYSPARTEELLREISWEPDWRQVLKELLLLGVLQQTEKGFRRD